MQGGIFAATENFRQHLLLPLMLLISSQDIAFLIKTIILVQLSTLLVNTKSKEIIQSGLTIP
jgi:hypothetical protein